MVNFDWIFFKPCRYSVKNGIPNIASLKLHHYRTQDKENAAQGSEGIQTTTEKLKEKSPRTSSVEKNWKKQGGYYLITRGIITKVPMSLRKSVR